MIINKQQLQEALEIVKPGLANKELIEQSTSFAFVGGRVVTYNDEISISHPVPGLELEGAIEADNLYKFIKRVKGDEIDLTVTGKEVLLTSGKAKAGFTLQTEIKLPLKEEITNKGKLKNLPEKFVKQLNFSMIAFTRGISRGVLICAHVNKEGFIESADGYRLVHCELGEEMPVNTFLIPVNSAAEMLRLNPVQIAEGKGWMHFKTEEGTVISCRLFSEDEFPNSNALISIKGERFVFPETTLEVLQRAMVFSKRDRLLEENVDILIQNNRLTVEAKSDTGWFKEEINFKHPETLLFSITPYLLVNILEETKECQMTGDKIKFQGEDWVYVSRLRNPKK
jgi:hypothetical protein